MSSIREQFEELVLKGTGLYADMARAIEQRGHIFRPLPTIAPNYIIALDPPSIAVIDEGMVRQLEIAEQPTRDYVYTESTNPENEQVPYQNYVHIRGRTILCTNNYASRDLFWKQPGQIRWTDLMAVTFHRVTTAHGGNTRGLETIWRLLIKNKETQSIIKAVCGSPPRIVDLQAGDDGFFALLGSDHGKGPARMLTDYPQIFGRRIIASVRVFPFGALPNLV